MDELCGEPNSIGGPCRTPKMKCPHHQPHFPAHGQPLLEGGGVDVRALVARWDADYNEGLGAPR